MDQQAPRVEIESDIDFILRACLPDEWPDAQPEPKLITNCLHPMEELKVNMMSQTVYCAKCLTKLTEQAISIRMDAYDTRQ